jgi:Ser/Thr protein kinase RdoA (MazF antagonist)
VVRLADVVRAFGAEPRVIRWASHRHNTHWRVVTTDGAVRFLRRFGEQGGLDADAAWESEALTRLAAAGAEVAAPLSPPRRIGGRLWALYPHLAGRKLGGGDDRARTNRALGRGMAAYHAAAVKVRSPGQRPRWCEQGQAFDPPFADREALLTRLQAANPEHARLVRDAADRLERRDLAGLFAGEPRIIVHGDYAPWNVLRRDGRAAGVLDFELAHEDVRAADLAAARRGYHDDVVEGYLERASLPAAHLAALDGLWTGFVLFGLWRGLAMWPQGAPYDPATIAWNLEQFRKTRPYSGRTGVK